MPVSQSSSYSTLIKWRYIQPPSTARNSNRHTTCSVSHSMAEMKATLLKCCNIDHSQKTMHNNNVHVYKYILHIYIIYITYIYYIYIHTYYIYICVYVRMYLCMCVCMCAHIYIYIVKKHHTTTH